MDVRLQSRTQQRREDRVLGRYEGDSPGPTLIITAGIHGNERAGVVAAQRVFAQLGEHSPPAVGRAIALAGNRAGLQRNQRFIDQDLNRLWSPTAMREFLSRTREGDRVEDAEQAELYQSIVDILGKADPGFDRIFVDMHTFSAPGTPFALCSDTLTSRAFARRLPLPLILGLEEAIDGTLGEFMIRHCNVVLAVEGGQSEDPASADCLESVLWVSLVSAGVLRAKDCPGYESHVRRLRELRRHHPKVTGIIYRHPVQASDGYVMEPGYRNFQPVKVGEKLGRDRRGDVRAQHDAVILMPLYQSLGNDAYFLGAPRNGAWLWWSTLLRRLHGDYLLTLLPGLERVANAEPGEYSFRVEGRALRLASRGLLQFFGYRKVRREGGALVFSRRPERTVDISSAHSRGRRD